MKRKSSMIAAGKEGHVNNNSLSDVADLGHSRSSRAHPSLRVHLYLSACRVCRYNSKGNIAPLVLTVRSDAVFFCSDRDFSIRRVVPIALLKSVTYYPYRQKLRLIVSGEHDVLLTCSRGSGLATTGDDGVSTRESQQDEFHTLHGDIDVIPEDDTLFVDAPLPDGSGNMCEAAISQSLESVAEAIDKALMQYWSDFRIPSQDENDQQNSGSMQKDAYRTLTGMHLGITRTNPSPATAPKPHRPVRVSVSVIDALDADIAPKSCSLKKAMDYLSTDERLELRRRGSKRLVAVTRLTIEFWDLCAAIPPPSVPTIGCTIPSVVSSALRDEPIVMKGTIYVHRVVVGVEVLAERSSSDSEDGVEMSLIATPRRILVFKEAHSHDEIDRFLVVVPVAGVHSISVHSDTWPPRRMEVRYLALGSVPSSIDFALSADQTVPAPPEGDVAGNDNTKSSTRTSNVVVIAEFVARLAARDGVNVRVVHYHPPAALSATQRMQTNSRGTGASLTSPTIGSFSERILQRARDFSPMRNRSTSPESPMNSPQINFAATLSESSEQLKQVASTVLQTISSGVQDVVTFATTGSTRSNASPACGNATSSPQSQVTFDAAVSSAMCNNPNAIQGAFFAVPVTGKVSQAAKIAAQSSTSPSFARRASFQQAPRGQSSPTGGSTLTKSVVSFANSALTTTAGSMAKLTKSKKDQLFSENIRKALPLITGITDYCRPSVIMKQAFDDGGIRKVLLARYVVRVATDDEIRKGETHAPRILALSEHFNGADPRLIIADRKFLARAKLPYSLIHRIDLYADDVLEIHFFPSEEHKKTPGVTPQKATFVFDEKKHSSLGDHPATRLADLVSVIRQSLAIQAKIFSHETFSPYRSIASMFLSTLSKTVAADARARARSYSAVRATNPSFTSENTSLSHDGEDADRMFCEVVSLHVPDQFCLPTSLYPQPNDVLPAGSVKTKEEAAAAGHGTEGTRFVLVKEMDSLLHVVRVQRLASDKVRWLDRLLVITVPIASFNPYAVTTAHSSQSSQQFVMYLLDDKGFIHRRIESRSILSANLIRDFTFQETESIRRKPPVPHQQGCILDFAIHGERRLILRLKHDGTITPPSSSSSSSPQKWTNDLPPPPATWNPLTDLSLPLPLLIGWQLLNMFRHYCSFEFDESYDESRYYIDSAPGKPRSWVLDPNEVCFMRKKKSTSRVDYFSGSRSPRPTTLRVAELGEAIDGGTGSFDRVSEQSAAVSDENNLSSADNARYSSAEVVSQGLFNGDISDVVFEELLERRRIHGLWHTELTDITERQALQWKQLLECFVSSSPDEVIAAAESSDRMCIETERNVYIATALFELYIADMMSILWEHDVIGFWTCEVDASWMSSAEFYLSEHLQCSERLFAVSSQDALLNSTSEASTHEVLPLTKSEDRVLSTEVFDDLAGSESSMRHAIEHLELIRRHKSLVQRLRGASVASEPARPTENSIVEQCEKRFVDDCSVWLFNALSDMISACESSLRGILHAEEHTDRTALLFQKLEAVEQCERELLIRDAMDALGDAVNNSQASRHRAEELSAASNRLSVQGNLLLDADRCASLLYDQYLMDSQLLFLTIQWQRRLTQLHAAERELYGAKVECWHASWASHSCLVDEPDWFSMIVVPCLTSIQREEVRAWQCLMFDHSEDVQRAKGKDLEQASRRCLETQLHEEVLRRGLVFLESGQRVEIEFRQKMEEDADFERRELANTELLKRFLLDCQHQILESGMQGLAHHNMLLLQCTADTGLCQVDEVWKLWTHERHLLETDFLHIATLDTLGQQLCNAELSQRTSLDLTEKAEWTMWTQMHSVVRQELEMRSVLVWYSQEEFVELEEAARRSEMTNAERIDRCNLIDDHCCDTLHLIGHHKYCTVMQTILATLEEPLHRHALCTLEIHRWREMLNAFHVEWSWRKICMQLQHESNEIRMVCEGEEAVERFYVEELVHLAWRTERAQRQHILRDELCALAGICASVWEDEYGIIWEHEVKTLYFPTAVSLHRLSNLISSEYYARWCLDMTYSTFMNSFVKMSAAIDRRMILVCVEGLATQETTERSQILTAFQADIPKIKLLAQRRITESRQRGLIEHESEQHHLLLVDQEGSEWSQISSLHAKRMRILHAQVAMMQRQDEERIALLDEHHRTWNMYVSMFKKDNQDIEMRQELTSREAAERSSIERDAYHLWRFWELPFRWILQVFAEHHAIARQEEVERLALRHEANTQKAMAFQQQVMADITLGRQPAHRNQKTREIHDAAAPVTVPATASDCGTVMVGAGAGAVMGAATRVPVNSTGIAGTGTKIRVKFHENFLHIRTTSESFLKVFVKLGRADMRASLADPQSVPPATCCQCQCDRFRDALLIRPRTLRQVFSESLDIAENRDDGAVVVEVRTSSFHWVVIPWREMFREWIESGVEPIRQADRAVPS